MMANFSTRKHLTILALFKLFREYEDDADSEKKAECHLLIIRQLQEWQLLPYSLKCPRGHSMQLTRNSQKLDQFSWRCRELKGLEKKKSSDQCGYGCSLRKGTFMQGSHLSMFQIVGFVNLWLKNCQLNFIMDNLELSSHTAVDWSSFSREVVFDYCILNKKMLGGYGKTVEIDESKFGKRKYHKGHTVEGQWVFGGIERESGCVFMVPVEDRSSKTLIKLIKEWITPNTIIISDCWKAYDCIEKQGFFKHLTVNHSINFKDPDTGAHTNTIESSWRHAKLTLPKYHQKKAFIAGYLAKYMFLKSCKLQKIDPTLEFLKAAGQLYYPNLHSESEESFILSSSADEVIDEFL